ncbi:MAG: hypothetical protein ABR961_01875 [Thermoanaerobaculaceae bacterium]
MRRLPVVLAGAAVLAGTLWLYAPASRLELMGDDYQWVQHTHRAMHQPALLFADLDTFYRPTTTWLLAFDRALWGYLPLGYHLTNVLLHAAAGIALALAGKRLGLPAIPSWAVGLVWAGSPFTDEPAISVAIRFEDLLLLTWLGTILCWPKPGDKNRIKSRWIAVAVLVCLAALSKETWVVTPGLVFALEWAFRRLDVRRALRTMAPFVALVAAYVAIYFAGFPGGKGYFDLSLRPLLKVPYQMASFLYLVGFVPLEFPFSAPVAIGLLASAALVVFVFMRRSPAGVVGGALLLFPMLPTLLVPYLPARYTAIPYAGFLLLLASAVHEGTRKLEGRWRPWVRVASAVLVALVLIAGAFAVRGDLSDSRRISEAHRILLDEARAAVADFPPGPPVLVLREEDDNPLRQIAASPLGLPKLLFPRDLDPYGLIDTAALFEWVLAKEEVAVVRYDDGDSRFRGRPGAVLSHRSGGFVWLTREVPDLGGLAERARLAGVRCRVIAAEPLRR